MNIEKKPNKIQILKEGKIFFFNLGEAILHLTTTKNHLY